MTVLVVSGIWPPDVGGPATHAPEVAAFLQGRGHDVRAVTTAVAQPAQPVATPVVTPTDDNRSYHISSEKIKRELGYSPRYSIEDAVRDLKAAFDQGKIKDSLTNPLYYNIKRMQEVHLK